MTQENTTPVAEKKQEEPSLDRIEQLFIKYLRNRWGDDIIESKKYILFMGFADAYCLFTYKSRFLTNEEVEQFKKDFNLF